MARITVEDCLLNVPNPYDLTMLAAHRARLLRFGAMPTVPVKKDAITVTALREIAAGTIDLEQLRASFLMAQRSEGTPDYTNEGENLAWSEGANLDLAADVANAMTPPERKTHQM